MRTHTDKALATQESAGVSCRAARSFDIRPALRARPALRPVPPPPTPFLLAGAGTYILQRVPKSRSQNEQSAAPPAMVPSCVATEHGSEHEQGFTTRTGHATTHTRQARAAPTRKGLISMIFFTLCEAMYGPCVERESTDTSTPP